MSFLYLVCLFKILNEEKDFNGKNDLGKDKDFEKKIKKIEKSKKEFMKSKEI